MSLPTWLTVFEVLGLLALVAGIALVYVPAALIAGGALTVVVCEMAESRRRHAELLAPRAPRNGERP